VNDEERRHAGRRRRALAQGPKSDTLQDIFRSIDPQMADWADRFIFGEVWEREGLEHEERMLVAIAALAAIGSTDMLRNYLWGALHGGIPPRKVHETLAMLTVYAGFPRSVDAMRVWREIVLSARRHGMTVDVEVS
jgi:4-carboxymuconolactone decarboxylase